jgi:hypothetical protein
MLSTNATGNSCVALLFSIVGRLDFGEKRKRTGWDAYTLICTGAPRLEGTGFIKWGLKTKNRLTK